jgi:hypothetical protein
VGRVTPSPRIALTAALAALPGLAACGGAEPAPPAAVPVVRGAAIDGSDDAPPPSASGARPGGGAAAGSRADEAPVAIASAGGEGGPDDGDLAIALDPDPEPELEPEPEPEPEGPRRITFRDLSLIDFDVDAMLDYRLFPDEYEGEDVADLAFPEEITALDGREVSLVGYMIPGKIEKGGDVRDFMLVRDLLGCCFGGTPMPDEWVDVVVAEGARAEYRAYLPMRVTGVMTLGGEQDEAGFALGVYRMKATAVQPED